MEVVTDFVFGGGLQNHCGWWLLPQNSKVLSPWKKSYDKPRQHIKKQRHHFADKGLYNLSHGFSSSHVCMWELHHREGWTPKNWCSWSVALEKSPLDSTEIKPVNPKGNQSWIFIGRTDAEAQSFGHLIRRAHSLEKTLMLGKIEGKRRRGWHGIRWLDGKTQRLNYQQQIHSLCLLCW